MNVFDEECNQLVSLFFLVLNKSCGGSFPKKLHQASLHHQPDGSRQVENHCHEDQVYRDPLVVRVVDGPLNVLLGVAQAN